LKRLARHILTPGLRRSDDPIEQRAIALAQRMIDTAHLLIAMRDGENDWPISRRPADLHVVNKIDLARTDVPPHAIGLSAITGAGVDRLVAAITEALGLREVPPDQPWAFGPALRRALRRPEQLHALLAAH
jgi:tRNA U34 5-carboxymethylaminomethyl modifying GTPase MnmE/TrmE